MDGRCRPGDKAAGMREQHVIFGIFLMLINKVVERNFSAFERSLSVCGQKSTLFPLSYKALQRLVDKVLQIGTRFH